MCALLLAALLFFLFLVALGFVLLVKAGRLLVQGDKPAKGLWIGLAGLSLAVGLPYLALCWRVNHQTWFEAARCEGNLASIRDERSHYKWENPGREAPARWLGEGPEPVCGAVPPPLPYMYMPDAKTTKPDTGRWVAYCPHVHRYKRWALWDPFGVREDRRIVGTVDRSDQSRSGCLKLSEEEFQKRLSEQMEIIRRARATSQPASEE